MKQENLIYKDATIHDIDVLVEERLKFIHASEEQQIHYKTLKQEIEQYFTRALTQQECEMILAYDLTQLVGTGCIFYYSSLPSLNNINGKNAYITSISVIENYRGNGIAREMMNKLIQKAKNKDCSCILLNATDMGKTLYESLGFHKVEQNYSLKLK